MSIVIPQQVEVQEVDLSNFYNKTETNSLLNEKVNSNGIKTINGNTILGAGDLEVLSQVNTVGAVSEIGPINIDEYVNNGTLEAPAGKVVTGIRKSIFSYACEDGNTCYDIFIYLRLMSFEVV